MKEIKIGDKIFREGQILRSVGIDQKDDDKPRPYFYIIEKICPKIAKIRAHSWDCSTDPPKWISHRYVQHLQHNTLGYYSQARKVDLDNHIHMYKRFYESILHPTQIP